MKQYHVSCGVAGIYAGQVDKDGIRWTDKSDVTDECTSAVAQYLVDNDQIMAFKYKGKTYIMQVKEKE